MREEKRIPLVLEFFWNNPHLLADFCNINTLETANLLNNWKNIEQKWLEGPDQRFGQLLINNDYLNDRNLCWITEESDWLVNNGYIKIEELCYWGKNVDENGQLLPETENILLKDLTTDHIKNIIKFFKNKKGHIRKEYLDYFNKRLKK